MDDATEGVDGLVTLQERMVNLINQLSMPLVEVSLVLQKHIKGLSQSLDEYLNQSGDEVPERVSQPWPIDVEQSSSQANFSLEKVLKIVDHQRMDILEALIRVTLIEIEVSLIEGILALRAWEQLARTQLAQATGPGQLFSPLEIPENW
ncbi:MAG: hypothetical protein CMA10_05615 [Euryarchaeota archaeon]|nr:hypothetical protein [Euryarchaeota archaeon]